MTAAIKTLALLVAMACIVVMVLSANLLSFVLVAAIGALASAVYWGIDVVAARLRAG